MELGPWDQTCPSCRRPTAEADRYPNSAWCRPCVDATLVAQERIAANTRVKHQEFAT